ncbi:beta-galactosidase [Microlunatus panaciterrae]|uniref:Beta-galactosidase n=1 Tax=Microlunatus panaciterrae TaxID=400768 RepID=A0ABS2RGJ3_9ACTN|nr:beta-galactosidase [Microlunatus panaciterrae]MBM7798125.1 beta-galactosidase [Microlunatus panaciterrae]
MSAVTASRGLLYGADYNPEQWPPAVWREDVALMRQAGVNLATVGVFSWAMLEPAPGEWDFGWLDDVLALLTDNGIGVDLATPTASPPPWLGHRWPDALTVNRDGVRMSNGSRNHFCPTSERYRERSRAVVAELVNRYASHPGVVMWHVGNEFGQVCHCDSCAVAFRSWLRARYGDLAGLNQAWGTSFWSQRYSEWAEVVPPRAAPYLINPSQQLDFRRFASDALRELYLEQRRIIAEQAPHVPVTTNFMGFFPHVDYHSWAEEIDVIADDSYPDPADPQAPMDTALTHDLMRSLSDGRGWMLMEQAAGAVNWRDHNVPKTPQRMRLDSLQAIARGSDGSCFFQWRASTFGAERFHSALLPHAGADTEVFRGVCRHGADLARLKEVAGSRSHASVALLFDWSSWWAAEEDAMPSRRLRVLDQLRSWYRPLWRAGVLVDVRSAGDDLFGYPVVLAPQLYLVDDEALAGLRDYVRQGGHLVLGPFSAVADSRGHLRPGRFPVGLTEVIGGSGEEWLPLPDGIRTGLLSERLGDGEARTWGERLRAEGADVMASFTGGPLDGLPAVLDHRFGAGRACYLGTVPAPAQLERLLDMVLTGAGVAADRERPPVDVEVVRRGEALFVINHGWDERGISVPHPVRDLLTDTVHSATVPIPAQDARVLIEESR